MRSFREAEVMESAVVIPYRPEAYAEADRSIVAAAADGASRVVLDLDGVRDLEIADVRRLIELLRRARARGVELALSVGGPHVRATLEGMALDRIFAILSPEAA